MIEGFEHFVRQQVPLASYTSLRLGGPAEYFAEPTSEDELVQLVRRFAGRDLPVRVIGGGSNLLVRDEGVSGLVVHLGAPAFCELTVDGHGLTAGGGVRLSHFVSAAVREGFAGPEQLTGIPGTVGGALHCNSGAGGFDLGTWVERVVAITRRGERVERKKEAMTFSYRSSSLNELAVLSATFQFQRESPEALTREMQKTWIVRSSRQPPLGERCAWMFCDHAGEPVARLIERAGLNGTKSGNVEISGRDSSFVVAQEGATSADVLRLLDLVRNQVLDKLGIDLTPAIEVW
jgi:UDP-N-acetylmuramate dehydrogenase